MLSGQEKKELKGRIVKMVLSSDESRPASPAWMVTSIQKRPYTGVNIAANLPLDDHNGYVFTAAGFSKVCYPDKWDANYGLELAIRKAAADIVRQWDAFRDLGGYKPCAES